jgi:hypothetical protein
MRRTIFAVVTVVMFAALTGGAARSAPAVLPPGNAAEQWDKIAEDTVVGSGAFQSEGFIYMAYVTNAMYHVATPLGRRDGFADAAVIGAAYTTLAHYFPAQSANLAALHQQSLAAVANPFSRLGGDLYGTVIADLLIRDRQGDGLVTPIGSTSSFPTLPPGPGVYRLTPSAYQAPQTPWVGQMRPFILQRPDQFLPPPPPSLSSPEWVAAFNEIKVHGSSTNPDTTETNIAQFWTANVVRQYNGLTRDIATGRNLDLATSARLFAMVNVVAADAGIAMMNAKYHYLFWRPVTAIDPTSVEASDGFGPSPGYDDGNPLTVEQPGWRPLLTTPNHPEYPSAHSTFTSAIMEVLTDFLGTSEIDVDVHGFDPSGPAGNMNAVHHFATADDLRAEVANARVWGGLHYRFSTVAGSTLGKQVADYDLAHAFAG